MTAKKMIMSEKKGSPLIPRHVEIGGPPQEFPPDFFHKKILAGTHSAKYKKLGGLMTRPRTRFEAKIGPHRFPDFVPPSILMNSSPNLTKSWEVI
jgi:hypothetical protein